MGAPTQQFIDIAGIKDGVVVLKNGSYRMIFSVSAVNFSLKSEEEQNSLIFQYQSFLNSMHFPIQIVMRSKRLDLNPYLKKIEDIKEKQTNELIRLQTEDYMDFVSELINLANIMKKTFFVVVGYDPVTIKKPSILDVLFRREGPASLRISDQEFKRYKGELTERANVTASGLGSMGLHCVQLNTEEVIELFYGIYNPEIADKERFTDIDQITSSFIADERERKPEEGAEEKKDSEKKDEEAVIDNSSIIEEQQKKDMQMKEQASLKEGEKQIATSGGEKVASSPGTPPVEPSGQQTPPQPPQGNPAAAPQTQPAAAENKAFSQPANVTPEAVQPNSAASPQNPAASPSPVQQNLSGQENGPKQ